MIEIVPYRTAWPAEFAALGQALRAAAGEVALAIHHIGSTAVPGLAAKDVIDIQLTVAALDAPLAARLAPLGYDLLDHIRGDHCPPGLALPPAELEKRIYRGQRRPANLHLRAAGRFNQRYPLLCRDYLRGQPLAASAYGEVKRQLARRFAADKEAYYDIKDPVFDILMAGAEIWASQTAWRLPPSDA